MMLECMTILEVIFNPGIDRTKIFYKGELEIEDYDNACEIAGQKFIRAYYSGYKRRSFVYADAWIV